MFQLHWHSISTFNSSCCLTNATYRQKCIKVSLKYKAGNFFMFILVLFERPAVSVVLSPEVLSEYHKASAASTELTVTTECGSINTLTFLSTQDNKIKRNQIGPQPKHSSPNRPTLLKKEGKQGLKNDARKLNAMCVSLVFKRREWQSVVRELMWFCVNCMFEMVYLTISR